MDDPVGQRFVGLQAALFVVVGFGPWLPLTMDAAVPPQARWIGLAIMLAGLLLALAAGLRLGRNLTPFPRPRPGGELVTAGVYAFARHPIYGGVLLLAIGWSVAQSSVATLAATALLWALFEAKSRYEERALAEAYPEYPRYAAATRRFVPFVY
ncbi:MAG: isoprenylcysteine carboxylmethyltransferase family protein [Trueperaceae bacterium]|nr:isoprenylcysteine carboxylmethyltransferase family protein [Trueperaceae bacterium]